MRFRYVSPSTIPIFPAERLHEIVTASGVQSTINSGPTGGAMGQMELGLGGLMWGATVAVVGAAVGAGIAL